MRTRTGNPFAEAHGQPMTCIDWYAPPGETPDTVRLKIEAAIGPLADPLTGAVCGYINTSYRPDLPLYVSLQLYNFDCLDLNCPAGHTGHPYRRVTPLTTAQRAALTPLEGPIPLTVAALRERFGPNDPPNRPIPSP